MPLTRIAPAGMAGEAAERRAAAAPIRVKAENVPAR